MCRSTQSWHVVYVIRIAGNPKPGVWTFEVNSDCPSLGRGKRPNSSCRSIDFLHALGDRVTHTHKHTLNTSSSLSIIPSLPVCVSLIHTICREYLEERTFIEMLRQQMTFYINDSSDSVDTPSIICIWQTFMNMSRFIPWSFVVSTWIVCSSTTNRSLQIGLIKSLEISWHAIYTNMQMCALGHKLWPQQVKSEKEWDNTQHTRKSTYSVFVFAQSPTSSKRMRQWKKEL